VKELRWEKVIGDNAYFLKKGRERMALVLRIGKRGKWYWMPCESDVPNLSLSTRETPVGTCADAQTEARAYVLKTQPTTPPVAQSEQETALSSLPTQDGANNEGVK
jgi:hypothetical protein